MILLFVHVVNRLIFLEVHHHELVVSEFLIHFFSIIEIFLKVGEVVGQPFVAFAFGPFTCDNFLTSNSLSIFLHKSHLVTHVQKLIIICIQVPSLL